MTECQWCDLDDDGNVIKVCHGCARKQRTCKVRGFGHLIPFYVVMYGVSRHYGGPQEGGWYWDRKEALEVRKVWDWKQGLKAARELRKEYPTQERNRFSVLGDGQDTYIDCVVSPDYITENLTRPRYE